MSSGEFTPFSSLAFHFFLFRIPNLELLPVPHRGGEPNAAAWSKVQEHLRNEREQLAPALVPGDTWCLALPMNSDNG